MATRSFYLTATTGDGWRTLSETTQAAVTNADGWVTGTGATLHAEYQVDVERASTVFTGTTVPDGTLDTTLKDAFRSESSLNGTFASATWVFTFVVRPVTSAGGQNGRVRFRLIKANADGSSATEITAAQQQGSLVGLMSSTTTDYVSTLTVNPGAITLTNQYLFIQIAWERTVAGGMSTADVNWRTGSSASLGTRVVTADFAPGPQPITTPSWVAPANVCDSWSGTVLSGNFVDNTRKVGQSFRGNGLQLSGAEIGVYGNYGVTGTLVATIYATTGTHGTTALPTGTALATSDAVVNPLVYPSPYATLVRFDFTGANRILLTAGTTYFVAVEGSGVATEPFVVAYVTSGHAGNIGNFGGTAWSAYTSYDLLFVVSTAQALPPTARLPGQYIAAPVPIPKTSSLVAPRVQLGFWTVHGVSVRAQAAMDTAALDPEFSAPIDDSLNATGVGHWNAQDVIVSVPFQEVAFLLRRDTFTDGTLTLDLRLGSYSGTVLASVSIPVTDIPTVGTWRTFDLPVVIDPGGTPTAYTAMLSIAGATGGNLYIAYSADATRTMPSLWANTGSSVQYPGYYYLIRLLPHAVFGPTVSAEVIGDQAITGSTMATTSTLMEPMVAPEVAGDQAVSSEAITAGATVTAPTIIPGAVTITSASLASSAGPFAPTLAAALTTATRASTAAVAVPALAYALTTATRATSAQAFAPTLTPSVLVPTRPSTATLFGPTVTTAGALIGGTIAAGSLLFAPALAGLVRTRHFGYIMTTS